MFADVWTIALAAGSGRWLEPVTVGAPKQFWRPLGTSDSLLEATLARLHPLAVTERLDTWPAMEQPGSDDLDTLIDEIGAEHVA